MKTYITSDIHWGHTNILKFCAQSRARFKNDVSYMNEAIVKEWNESVNVEDLVYILGDVAFLRPELAAQYINRCNGRKILIQGNHDRKNLGSQVFRDCFEEIHHYLDINHNGTKVVMCHYPFHFEWDQAHRGSVHLHGHVHGAITGLEDYRARDVGMDATGKTVVLLDDIVADALKGKPCDHH